MHINAIQEFTGLAIMPNEPFYIMLTDMVTVKQQLLYYSSHSCWIWDDYHQLISNARPWNNNFVRASRLQKKNSIFLHEKSQILKSNFEGFSETKSRKKQLISHENCTEIFRAILKCCLLVKQWQSSPWICKVTACK